MGSRAVVLVCRSEADAVARFGVSPGMGAGAVWTRTGRPFFGPALTSALLDRVRAAAVAAGLFDELSTSWLLLDAELLPWSAKAGQLLRDQYAAVGAAARAALPAAVSVLEQAVERLTASVRLARRTSGEPADAAEPARWRLLARTRSRLANADAFAAAYQRYCWPVEGLDGVRLAPFVVLGSEGAAHAGRPHSWHLAIAARLAAADPEPVHGDQARVRGHIRSRVLLRRRRLVGRADRGRRRGHGRQARRRPGCAGPRASPSRG